MPRMMLLFLLIWEQNVNPCLHRGPLRGSSTSLSRNNQFGEKLCVSFLPPGYWISGLLEVEGMYDGRNMGCWTYKPQLSRLVKAFYQRHAAWAVEECFWSTRVSVTSFGFQRKRWVYWTKFYLGDRQKEQYSMWLIQ